MLTICPEIFSVDINTSCKLEIRVTSYITVIDGKKEYNRGSVIRLDVDSEEYSIIEMEHDMSVHYQWGSDQQASFWYEKKGQTVKLTSDVELFGLLRASEILKFNMIVDRYDHINMDVQQSQLLDDSQVIDEGEYMVEYENALADLTLMMS